MIISNAYLKSLHLLGAMCSMALLPDVRAQDFTIPVVFHVLHNGGPENISDAQIMDCLLTLNTAFGQGFDDPILPPFDTLAAQMDIAFCLATIAPDGSATTGIERIQTAFTDSGGVSASYLGQWPRDRYLNIWTVKRYADGVSPLGVYLPEEVNLDPLMDGVMVLHSFVGGIGTSSWFRRRSIGTLVGRYLNLKFLWEDPIGLGDCGDDGVLDTPPCELLFQCMPVPPSCQLGLSANVNNYMTYAYCNVMFTPGQKERVHACMLNSVAQRDQLWTPANLASTGCGIGLGLAAESLSSPPTVFPIPFGDVLHVSGLAHSDQVRLTDLTGRLLIERIAFTSTLDIGTTDLPAGAYLLRIGASGASVNKVVKQ